MDAKAIYELCTNDKADRENISLQDIDDMSVILTNEIQEKLELLYALLLLDGKIKSDEYFEEKYAFMEQGLKYGYVNCSVRQEKGTNAYRFYKRTPKGNGVIIRENIPITKEGFSKHQLHKQCSHEEEYELCIKTENYFKVLRADGKSIKTCARLLRSLSVIKRNNQNAEK